MMYPNGSAVTTTLGRKQGGAGPFGYSIFHKQAGDRFNRFLGEQWSKVLGGAPTAAYAPASYVLPRTPGAMASTTGNRLTMTNSPLVLQQGRNISGNITVTLTNAAAALQLIVLGSGTISVSLTVANAPLGAAVGISGSTTCVLTNNTPILGALAGLFASATVSVSSSGTLTATGKLAGNILPYTELSPENLARAVWEALAADYNATGTMGEKLNAAGSGGLTPTQVTQLEKAAKALQLGQSLALK